MKTRCAGFLLATACLFPLSQAVAMPREVTERDIKLTARPIKGQTDRDVLCLAYSIFREAGTLATPAQYAVGQVHINRLMAGSWGSQLCEVVYAHAQFSWTLNLVRTQWSQQQMQSAKAIAWNLIQGIRVKPLDSEQILHYHANYVRPTWSQQSHIVAQAGPHVFYRDIAH